MNSLIKRKQDIGYYILHSYDPVREILVPALNPSVNQAPTHIYTDKKLVLH